MAQFRATTKRVSVVKAIMFDNKCLYSTQFINHKRLIVLQYSHDRLECTSPFDSDFDDPFVGFGWGSCRWGRKFLAVS